MWGSRGLRATTAEKIKEEIFSEDQVLSPKTHFYLQKWLGSKIPFVLTMNREFQKKRIMLLEMKK